MKTIVCFGDSNTWGYDPSTSTRFAPDVRWTGVLQRELGVDFKVIEEGLNGRTTTIDDEIYAHRNGRTYLAPCLESHAPLDLVTIMLGTNDLKARLNRTASDIGESAGALADLARRSMAGPGGSAPKVLLIAPPPVVLIPENQDLLAGALEKSQAFPVFFKRRADRYGAAFFDAGSVIQTSRIDGVHFEAGEHAKLGSALAAVIRDLLA